MNINLSLRQKGLALVGILLVFELLLLGSLAILLRQAEEEAKKEAEAKQIIGHTTRLGQLVYEAGQCLKDYGTTRNPEQLKKFDEMVAEIPTIFEWMRHNVGSAEVSLINRIETNLNAGRRIMIFMRNKVETTPMIEMVALAMAANKKLDPLLHDQLLPDFLELRHREEVIESESPEQQRRVREQAERLLGLGVAMNVMMAVMLIVLFMRGITTRLSVLVDNTRRLAASKPLNPTLRGSDEIAKLDQTFHEMATALDEAARNERAVIESMPVGVLVIKHDGSIDSINSRTVEMLGYTTDELVGTHIMKLLPTSSDNEPVKYMSGIYPRYVGRVGEFKAAKKDGSELAVEFSLKEFSLSYGSRLLAVILDVTERYEIQKMRQAFVAMVSHELRTPLTGVAAFLALLTQGALKPEQVEPKAKAAENSVMRLISLVNELLDLEKLESGTLSLNLAPVAVANILELSDQAVAGVAEKKDLYIDLPNSTATIVADQDRLVQVLVNLLSNAIKFSPEKSGIRVTVNEEPDYIEFRVKDKGRGVPERYRETIFERFQQVEASDSTKKGGTGLGLPICKAIVEQHGGSIGVESEEGKGSEFWFRIPHNLQGTRITVPGSERVDVEAR
jgi:PAS domain S-box-containing protein